MHDVAEGAFKIRAAESWGARHSASMLISRLYGRRGYRNNPLPAHPDSNQFTLVASAHDALVGTMTVRFDSDERLLADDLFPDEVNALRESGRRSASSPSSRWKVWCDHNGRLLQCSTWHLSMPTVLEAVTTCWSK